MRRVLVVAVLLAGGSVVASAQDPDVLLQQAPNMPPLQRLPPEEIEPEGGKPDGDPSETGSTETLSEKLERSEGVIEPPETGAPDITVPPPVPDPGTTLVIPPPGSPGGRQDINPK